MKITSFVRPIDGLGRVVIPVEIRRILALETSDQLEVFVEDERIVMRRYQHDEDIQGAAEVLGRLIQNNRDRLKNPEGIEEKYQELLKELAEQG